MISIDEFLLTPTDQLIAIARVRLRRKITSRMSKQGIALTFLNLRGKPIKELSLLSVMLKRSEKIK